MALGTCAKASVAALTSVLFLSASPLALAQTPLTPAPAGSELTQLDGWSVGAIGPSQGGLPPTLWAGSDPVLLGLVFERLPAAPDSPAARELMRRVLLSGGTAPRGAGADEAARGRFEALAKLGAADELSIMSAAVGQRDALITQFAAQAELARGRLPQACARARGVDGETPSPFLLRVRALCAASDGDRAAADLALELAAAANAADAWYTAATAAAGGAPGARPPTARYDSSLNVQLSLAGNLAPPRANPLGESSNLALLTMARAPNAPHALKAQAAALAFQRGALSAREARDILRAIPPEATTGLPPIALALREVDAAKAAQAAARAAPALDPASPTATQAAAPTLNFDMQIATAIANVLRQATTPADFTAAANFFKEDIAALSTAPDPAAALLLARASVVTGDLTLAGRLVNSVAQAGVAPEAVAPLQVALAAYRGTRTGNSERVVARRIDAGGASLRQAAARDVAILGALGFPVDASAQAFLLENAPSGGARADSGVLAALRAAVERRSAGEALLLAVVASGEGPASLDVDSLAQIIGALRTLGFEDEARRFAVEALLAGQPR